MKIPATSPAIILIFFSVLFLFSHPLDEKQFSTTADEGYYFRYASLISEEGIAVYPKLIADYAHNEKTRFYPAPSRIGYLLPAALLFKMFGPSYSLLAGISLFSFLSFLIVFFYFCRKHFGNNIAVFSTVLLSSSPLLLAMSRRALTDSTANLTWGLTAWLFLDYLVHRKQNTYSALILSLACAILIKESSLVLFPFLFITTLVYNSFHGQKKVKLICLGGIFLWPVIIVLTAFLLTLGGPAQFLQAIQGILLTHFNSPLSNPYNLFSTGPWYRYIVDFLLLSPVTTLLFIGYAFYLVAIRSNDWKKIYFLLYFILVYGFSNLLQYSKVIRFVMNLDMVICLFSVLALYELFGGQNQGKGEKYLRISCLIIFFINFYTFLTMFYIGGLYDPISYHLLALRKFILPH